jgi:hypothetical protein
MVKKKTVEGRTVYLCEICGLGYADKKTAQDCEDWCRTHPGNCSLEISKKAIYSPDIGFMELKKEKKE